MNKICVKISICKNYCGGVDDVVYYRNWITVEMVSKWLWYFDYLVALIKTHNPKMHVILEIGRQTLPQGREYVKVKSKDLLISKKVQLNKLMNQSGELDLFCFNEERKTVKIERIKSEIEALERGEFNYYVPKEYINKVKEYLKC
jgi:hypothetical protein